jgi:hypothetical protein
MAGTLQTQTLQIGPGKSKNCSACAITIDPTLSSATVVLTRDIMGKIIMPPRPVPPSNLPFLSEESGHSGCSIGGGKWHGPPGNVCCNNGCGYTVPYPNNGDRPTKLSWADGTLLSDHGNRFVSGNNTAQDWENEYQAHKREEETHKKQWEADNKARIAVRIWNPSDDPLDPARSIVINHRKFGALTKLFIKPTIPFPISFSFTGPDVPKAVPEPYSQHEQDIKIAKENIAQNIEGNRMEREKEERQGATQDALYVPPTPEEFIKSSSGSDPTRPVVLSPEQQAENAMEAAMKANKRSAASLGK